MMMKSPELRGCSPASVASGLMEIYKRGLEPGINAHLIPFKGEAKVIYGYQGLVELARRSGQVSTIWAEIVCEKDHFRILSGTDPKLEHEIDHKLDDRGPMLGAYAVAKLKDGNSQWAWMTKSQIDAIRKRAASSKKTSPWDTDYEEMAKKTAVRRLSKLLPNSIELVTAVQYEENYEAENTRDLGRVESSRSFADMLSEIPPPGAEPPADDPDHPTEMEA